MEVATLSLVWILAGQFNLSDDNSTITPPNRAVNSVERADNGPPYGGNSSTFQLPDLSPPTASAPTSATGASNFRGIQSVYAPPELSTPSESPAMQGRVDTPAASRISAAARSLAEPVRSHVTTDTSSPPGSVNSTAKLGAASRVLQGVLTAQDRDALPGAAVGLQEVLRRAPDAPARRSAILAFWNLSVATAIYNCAKEEQAFLETLPAPVSPADQAVLSAELAAARATCSEAKLAAMRSQQRLADLIQWPLSGKLPLAADQPFVGAYRTYFETLNARGAAPDHLAQVDRILPALRGLIDDRAAAVEVAEDCRLELRRACEVGQAALDAVLRIHVGLKQQRRAFLASVQDYNEQIASYALAVAVPGQSEERLAGMLIERPVSTSLPGEERSVLAGLSTQDSIQRVSNEEPLEAPALDPVTPIQVTPTWRRD